MSLCCGCLLTKESSISIIERFGKFKKAAEPGCMCLVPCIDTIAGTLSLKLEQQFIRLSTKTLDDVTVLIEVSLHYQVLPDQAQAAFYSLQNVPALLESCVADAVRSEIPLLSLDELFRCKKDFSIKMCNRLSEALQKYGYKIVSMPITKLLPDAEVQWSMNEIDRQKRLRMAAEMKGDAWKVAQRKDAEAEASRIRIQAQADSDAQYLSGQGISRQRQALVAGFSSSVKSFSSDLAEMNPKEIMEMLIITQYFDTLKDLASDTTTRASFTQLLATSRARRLPLKPMEGTSSRGRLAKPKSLQHVSGSAARGPPTKPTKEKSTLLLDDEKRTEEKRLVGFDREEGGSNRKQSGPEKPHAVPLPEPSTRAKLPRTKTLPLFGAKLPRTKTLPLFEAEAPPARNSPAGITPSPLLMHLPSPAPQEMHDELVRSPVTPSVVTQVQQTVPIHFSTAGGAEASREERESRGEGKKKLFGKNSKKKRGKKKAAVVAEESADESAHARASLTIRVHPSISSVSLDKEQHQEETKRKITTIAHVSAHLPTASELGNDGMLQALTARAQPKHRNRDGRGSGEGRSEVPVTASSGGQRLSLGRVPLRLSPLTASPSASPRNSPHTSPQHTPRGSLVQLPPLSHSPTPSPRTSAVISPRRASFSAALPVLEPLARSPTPSPRVLSRNITPSPRASFNAGVPLLLPASSIDQRDVT